MEPIFARSALDHLSMAIRHPAYAINCNSFFFVTFFCPLPFRHQQRKRLQSLLFKGRNQMLAHDSLVVDCSRRVASTAQRCCICNSKQSTVINASLLLTCNILNVQILFAVHYFSNDIFHWQSQWHGHAVINSNNRWRAANWGDCYPVAVSNVKALHKLSTLDVEGVRALQKWVL